MAVLYLDTSALGRAMLGEPDADAVRAALAAHPVRVSSRLLAVELRRLAARRDVEAAPWLDAIALVPITGAILDVAAGLDPSTLGTLDAIHLATLLATRTTAAPADALLTYDRALADAARHHQVDVMAPSA